MEYRLTMNSIIHKIQMLKYDESECIMSLIEKPGRVSAFLLLLCNTGGNLRLPSLKHLPEKHLYTMFPGVVHKPVGF